MATGKEMRGLVINAANSIVIEKDTGILQAEARMACLGFTANEQ